MLIAPSNVSDTSHSNNAYKGKALHYDMTCISDIYTYISMFLGMLVRALYEHWSRSPPGSDIANLIKAYLMFQVSQIGLTLVILLTKTLLSSMMQS